MQKSAVSAEISYSPSTGLFDGKVILIFEGVPETANVQEDVTSVPPTNTLKVPPASSKAPEAKVPSYPAETVCAVLVRKPIIASDPSCTAYIVTESVATKVPGDSPVLASTVTFVKLPIAGSSA